MSNPIKLGENDIHRMGYGTIRLPGMRDVLENEELARSLLISAVEQGVNVIDTADYYGNGLAKRLKVALAWLLQLSPVMVPIPGTSSLKHLSENITAAELNLEPEDVAILSNIA